MDRHLSCGCSAISRQRKEKGGKACIKGWGCAVLCCICEAGSQCSRWGWKVRLGLGKGLELHARELGLYLLGLHTSWVWREHDATLRNDAVVFVSGIPCMILGFYHPCQRQSPTIRLLISFLWCSTILTLFHLPGRLLKMPPASLREIF